MSVLLFLLSTLLFAFLLACIFNDADIGVLFSIFLGWVLLELGYKIPVWTWLGNHQKYLFIGFGVYMAIGLAISTLKFYFFYKKRVDELASYQKEWVQDFLRKRSTSKEMVIKAWNLYADERLPHVKRMAPTCVRWMIYWPFHGLQLLFKDFLYECGLWIYKQATSLFQGIANHLKKEITLDENSTLLEFESTPSGKSSVSGNELP